MGKKHKLISYAKWGYIFIAPFFIVYFVFQLIPLLSTFYYSFFEYFFAGGKWHDPEFVGFQNYIDLFATNEKGEIPFFTYAGNTMIMWIIGAVPQLIFSLLLAIIFTSARLKIKGQRFFKTVIYMPNLIMAAAFGMLFFMIFSKTGPINQLLTDNFTNGKEVYDFFGHVVSARSLVAFVNFLMWFGNTTILLMAGIMGIDQSLFEAASIDGANSGQVFFKITLPLLMPILVYVAITSLIGGLQMYDVPQLLTRGEPNKSTQTLIMFLNQYVGVNKNYGKAGAISVLIFIVTGVLSLVVYKLMVKQPDKPKKKAKKGV